VIARYRERPIRGQSDGYGSASVARGKKPFRTLTAFGIWSDRPEIKDAIHFTTQLRRRMERGEESK
jgi:hypothetical protein